jgi:hypothetical protein
MKHPYFRNLSALIWGPIPASCCSDGSHSLCHVFLFVFIIFIIIIICLRRGLTMLSRLALSLICLPLLGGSKVWDYSYIPPYLTLFL